MPDLRGPDQSVPDFRAEVRRAIAELNLDLAREESLTEELAEDLAERYSELVAGGTSEDEAYRTVLCDLDEEKLRAALRTMFRAPSVPLPPGSEPRGGFFAGIGNDIRSGLRQLRLNPGFVALALLSLALGVGANTAVFELIDAVMMRALPIPDAEKLANVSLNHQGRSGSTVARQKDFSVAIWDELRTQQQGFSSLAAWSTERFDLGHGGEARYADGMWVSGSFFEVLQLQPIAGRLLAPSDDIKGCGIQGAVISYEFWQSEFGGRANAVGSAISLDRRPFQIVGITPPSFTGLEVGRKFDVAVPLCSEPGLHGEDAWSKSQITWWLAAVGRLKPGWNFDRVTAQLNSVAPGIFASTLPAAYDEIQKQKYLKFSFDVSPGATGVSSLRVSFGYPLGLLLAFSALVLLIACANIANLMLANASARHNEMALRLALGASRSRIIRQLLVESLLLAIAGAALGAGLARLLSGTMIAGIGTSQDQVFLSLSPDWRMLAFTSAVALLTCVVFGVAPAVHAAHAEPGVVIQSSGRGLASRRERFSLRRGFIVLQIALSLALVVAAVLFSRTFRNLMNLNAGFEQQHILVAEFDASSLNLPADRGYAFNRELIAQVRATPGVVSAASTAIVPLSGDGWNDSIDIPGTSFQRQTSDFSQVSSGYFHTLGVPMIAGRDFNATDTNSSPLVVIVNEAFAAKFFPDSSPLGATMGVRQDYGKPDKLYRIVGVVENTKYRDLREDYGPIAYVPDTQGGATGLDSTFVIRSNEDLASLIASLEATAARTSPEVVLNFKVLRTMIRDNMGRERMMAELSGFYGLLAALLATVGLYGMMSYSVVKRRTEIGIRIALGASRRRVLSMILREASILLAMGLMAGIALVIAAGRLVQSMLFGLQSTDPVTLVLAIAGMAGIGLLSSLLPARRAAAVQPMQTLREG